jgi:hypothetical protein
MIRDLPLRVILLVGAFFTSGKAIGADSSKPISIDARREPLVDDCLIDRMDGTELKLHRPVERNIAIVHDAPWEGNTSTYHTVFQDGDIYRMYYRGGHVDDRTLKESHSEYYCYAESRDGIRWTKPELGLIEFNGSKKNNIILSGLGRHNFAPFRDENPDCSLDARYKAVGGGNGGLIAFKSADAIHWSPISEKPVITEGAFDSLNIAFWDKHRGRYVDFHRDFHDGLRDIKTCTSTDFANWSNPDWVEYSGAPPQHLYTNAITPYPGAPHIYIGLPMRFVPDRNPHNHKTTGVSDCVLMTSRDGQSFRRWNEAFIRPGPQPARWISRNNLAAWGIVTTEPDVPGAPEELSLYATEGYYHGKGTRLRRYTLRRDGFVSVNSPAEGGEMVTKPLIFRSENAELLINFATSAVGGLRCEIQDAAGQPLPGFSLAESVELYGDEVAQPVVWQGTKSVSALAGAPIRLRFVMQDADLYAIEFRPREMSKVSANSSAGIRRSAVDR